MKTSEAFRQLLRCHVAIAVNLWRAVNNAVTHHPWAVLLITLATFTAVDAAGIMSARAERDRACKKQAVLQQQVEQLSCALEARKEAAR